MKKIILLVFFNVSFVWSLFAQHLTPLQEDVVRKTISVQFGEGGKTRILNLGKVVFCVLGNDTLYNPDGYNYVFKLHHDSITRLDCSKYHGSNHGRFLFANNGELCALGGYGFFTTNNNLQVFNPNVKEWLFKPTNGDVPDYINGLCFKIDDAVYSMNNFKSGNSAAPNLIDSCIYKLNLKTMFWERFYQMNYPSKIFGIAYITSKYSLIRGDLQTLLVKPSEFKFLLLNNEVFGIDNISMLDSISDDKLFFNSAGNSSGIIMHYTIDLDVIWKKHESIISQFDLKPIERLNIIGLNKWFIISLMLVLIIIIGYFAMIRSQAKLKYAFSDAIHSDMTIQNQEALQAETQSESIKNTQIDSEVDIEKENKKDIEEDLSDSLYKILLKSEKTFFNGDELDEIFAIAHLEPDSKKSKRHRYLANLDKNHPGFVVRIKEQIDKRRFNYKIVK